MQLFQSIPTKVAQNDSESPILPYLQLFQSFPTEVAQNDLEWPILPDSQLFQSFPTEVTQNGQFCLIHNFSNLFPPQWLRMTRNGQFCMAKIKYTLTQGNFYERLLFCMDSCALSPMASLLNTLPRHLEIGFVLYPAVYQGGFTARNNSRCHSRQKYYRFTAGHSGVCYRQLAWEGNEHCS